MSTTVATALLFISVHVASLFMLSDALPLAMRIKGNEFMLGDGSESDQVVRIHAGEMHYFRVPEAYWEDRILRMKALGLNSLSTYVAWNWHEEKEGQFDFHSEGKNVSKFLRLAKKHNMLAILRPGPYICAEWEFGGLPAWLLKYSQNEGMKIRTADMRYLQFVDRFWGQLLPHVESELLENGGAVAAVQLENEFGHFGDTNTSNSDLQYLKHLKAFARKSLGPNVFLLTTDDDQNTDNKRGILPEVFTAVNLGPWREDAEDHLTQAFGRAKTNNGKHTPEFVMELWTGWFTTTHKQTGWFDMNALKNKAGDLANYVKVLLQRNASFTLYMAHGGTNFGFMNSGSGLFQDDLGFRSSFITSSYDYLAPIAEEGTHGLDVYGRDKFKALQELLLQHRQPWESTPPEEPAPPRALDYTGRDGDSVRLQRRAALRDPVSLDALCDGGWQRETSDQPTTMEMYNQSYGFILYRHKKTSTTSANKKWLNKKRRHLRYRSQYGEVALKARDRVTVWHGSTLVLPPTTNTHLTSGGYLRPVKFPISGFQQDSSQVLDVMVENLGRRAFEDRKNHDMDEAWYDRKGMFWVAYDGEHLKGHWEVCSLPLTDLYGLNGSAPYNISENSEFKPVQDEPTFFEGTFDISSEPADTFLQFKSGRWMAGVAYLNGFNLGRYHRDSLAKFSMFVPKTVLRTGSNSLVLLEMYPSEMFFEEDQQVRFASKPLSWNIEVEELAR